jgi:ATP-dependent Lon protease
MSANQRRYMLMEQLKHIKKELGLEKVRATHGLCWRLMSVLDACVVEWG